MRFVMLKAMIEFKLHDLAEIRDHYQSFCCIVVQRHAFVSQLEYPKVAGFPHFAHKPDADANIRAQVPELMEEPFKLKDGNLARHVD